MSSDPLSTQVLALLAQTATAAQTKNELARTLCLPVDDRQGLRRALQELVDDGQIVEGDGRRYRLRSAGQRLLNGTIFSKPGGGGSFRPEQGDQENAAVYAILGADPDARLPIPEEHLGTALNGDRVSVKVTASEPPSWWRSEKARKESVEHSVAPRYSTQGSEN